MKGTKLLYRIDGRNGATISNKCPITYEEAGKIKNLREREAWTFLAGVNDEDMRAFKLNKKEVIKKLKETKYEVI